MEHHSLVRRFMPKFHFFTLIVRRMNSDLSEILSHFDFDSLNTFQ